MSDTANPAPPGQSAPAEVFHPSVFILEEMAAREWSVCDLAFAMGGDPRVNILAIGLYLSLGPGEPNLRIGDGEDFGRAFNVDAAFFRNLESAWLRHSL